MRLETFISSFEGNTIFSTTEPKCSLLLFHLYNALVVNFNTTAFPHISRIDELINSDVVFGYCTELNPNHVQFGDVLLWEEGNTKYPHGHFALVVESFGDDAVIFHVETEGACLVTREISDVDARLSPTYEYDCLEPGDQELFHKRNELSFKILMDFQAGLFYLLRPPQEDVSIDEIMKMSIRSITSLAQKRIEDAWSHYPE